MATFQRYVAIDWSGAGKEHESVDLSIVSVGSNNRTDVVLPPRFPKTRKWSRAECWEWLTTLLRPDQPRTIVALDFGLGLPWGVDRAVFGCVGWHPMLREISRLYAQHGTARVTAQAINENLRFSGHGPYRFNESRTDFRFYHQHGVAYYRLVENAIPQAISQWYMGSGGTVAYHTITGLAGLHDLISLRDESIVQFRVWPQECSAPSEIGDTHLLVECYPALQPMPPDLDLMLTAHQRDAWKVATWMQQTDYHGQLENFFDTPALPFGRVEGISFQDQVHFEGWILGAGFTEGQ